MLAEFIQHLMRQKKWEQYNRPLTCARVTLGDGCPVQWRQFASFQEFPHDVPGHVFGSPTSMSCRCNVLCPLGSSTLRFGYEVLRLFGTHLVHKVHLADSCSIITSSRLDRWPLCAGSLSTLLVTSPLWH